MHVRVARQVMPGVVLQVWLTSERVSAEGSLAWRVAWKDSK